MCNKQSVGFGMVLIYLSTSICFWQEVGLGFEPRTSTSNPMHFLLPHIVSSLLKTSNLLHVCAFQGPKLEPK